MRALVISGGGSRGQYHVGALKYLYLDKGYQHQILCGNSVGALIAAFIAQYPYGKEADAINTLANLFLHIRTENVKKPWRPFGLFTGFRSKKSLWNSHPLQELISTHIDVHKIQSTGRAVRVGMTRISPRDRSNYEVATENHPELIQAIQASAALVPFFEPVRVDQDWAIDGGVQQITPIRSAIDAGATVIDVLMCYPPMLKFPATREMSVLNLGFFTFDLLLHNLAWTDVRRTQFINRMVTDYNIADKRRVELNLIYPSKDLGVNALEFNYVDALRLQNQGYVDARETHR
jgi:NTE family protein